MHQAHLTHVFGSAGPWSGSLQRWSLASAAFTCFLLTGCVTSTVEQVRQGATTMVDGDAVVLLGRRQNNGYETESKFVQCVGKKLNTNALPVVPEDEFVDTLFPWFEPRVAPINAGGLNEMLAQPLIAERLKEKRVRYLIWIDGSTSTTDSSGAMTCSASPNGVAYFGFLAWDKDSSYEATVWDVTEGTSVGKISSDASGTSYVPAIVLPVPLIAPVQSSACSALATQLRSFLGNEDEPLAAAVPAAL